MKSWLFWYHVQPLSTLYPPFLLNSHGIERKRSETNHVAVWASYVVYILHFLATFYQRGGQNFFACGWWFSPCSPIEKCVFTHISCGWCWGLCISVLHAAAAPSSNSVCSCWIFWIGRRGGLGPSSEALCHTVDPSVTTYPGSAKQHFLPWNDQQSPA